MVKKTIQYKDYNGDEVEETLYFHLDEANMIELEVSHKDGLAETMQKIMLAQDNETLYKEFTKILLLSYGKRSEDGKRFIKSQELRDEFRSTGAFPKLVVLLATDAEFAASFVQGIFPTEMIEGVDVEKIMKESVPLEEPVQKPENVETVTREQLRGMAREDVDKFVQKLRAGEVQIEE